MISSEYAKLILNAMFNIKEAGEDRDFAAEQQAEKNLITQMASAVNISNLSNKVDNVNIASYLSNSVYISKEEQEDIGGAKTYYGIPATAYEESWSSNKYNSVTREITAFDKLYDNISKKIKEGEIRWYTISRTSNWTFKKHLKDTNNDNKVDELDTPTHTYSAKGWYIKLREDGEINNYPTDAYLGLYIDPVGGTAGSGMPSANGSGGQEIDPTVVDGSLQYTRVNLHRDIVMGEDSLSIAATNDNGETILQNSSEILFPEILSKDSDLGSFSGFGIYGSNSDLSPIIWGRIKDEDGNPITVKAKQFHVPLFKTEDFKLILK